MKTIHIFFLFLLGLALVAGCGDTEESSDSVNPMVSIQELPADDDIEGLYNLGIPRGWFKTKDPVLYAKYFRAQLLRQFGNIPEIHIVADMELKKRQWIYPTRDEHIAYLEALYRLFPDKGTLEDLENERQRKAKGKPFVLIYAGAPAENIIKRLEEIYQRKLSREEAILEVAVIKSDKETLEAFGWQVHERDDKEDAEEFDAERFVDVFVPGGGILKALEKIHNRKHLDEEEPDEDEEEPNA